MVSTYKRPAQIILAIESIEQEHNMAIVKPTIKGSDVLQEIKELEKSSVEVLSCRTSSAPIT